jgi:hypothetical protein
MQQDVNLLGKHNFSFSLWESKQKPPQEVKVKVIFTLYEGTQGEQKYDCTLSLTSALDAGEVNSTPRLRG